MKPLAAGNEHTTGILFLKQHANTVQAWMDHASIPFFVHALNDIWSVLYVKDEKLEKPATVHTLIELSKFINLFYFTHIEDWGWGYRVFVNGFQVAEFYDDYHFDHTMAIQLAKERYPDVEDILYFLYFDKEGRSLLDSLVEEINSSRNYLEQQFKNKNIQSFEAFGLGDEKIAALDRLISIEGLSDKRLNWRQVEQFKEYLDMVEMTRRNFKYLVNILGAGIVRGQ